MAQTYNVGSDKQLLFDDELVEEKQGFLLTMNSAKGPAIPSFAQISPGRRAE